MNDKLETIKALGNSAIYTQRNTNNTEALGYYRRFLTIKQELGNAQEDRKHPENYLRDGSSGCYGVAQV
jgi:hypothetical protein